MCALAGVVIVVVIVILPVHGAPQVNCTSSHHLPRPYMCHVYTLFTAYMHQERPLVPTCTSHFPRPHTRTCTLTSLSRTAPVAGGAPGATLRWPHPAASSTRRSQAQHEWRLWRQPWAARRARISANGKLDSQFFVHMTVTLMATCVLS